MVSSKCGICGKEVVRAGFKAGRFCSRACASEHRRTWKPVSRDWLHQKYVIEGLGTVQIGRLVSRHPKRVYEWLVNLGIPTREKWHGNVPDCKPFHDPVWLAAEYAKGRSPYDIAEELGVASGTIYKYLAKAGIETRAAAETTRLSGKQQGAKGERNAMYGRKGSASPTWKGGHTPERQAFYNTQEWAVACLAAWKRDDATCQRCETRKSDESQKYCVHHIVSFAVAHLRAEPSNLILLCDECHRWVHSRKNKDREFIEEFDPERLVASG